jgi:hypothetical protein
LIIRFFTGLSICFCGLLFLPLVEGWVFTRYNKRRQMEGDGMTTIEIIREQADKQHAVYRAICGEQQAAGVTPGEALDALERLLATGAEEQEAGTVIIMQRFRPDMFFTEAQQTRLRELMDQFYAARDSGQEFPPEHKQELETLVQAEWQAAIKRAEALLAESARSAT